MSKCVVMLEDEPDLANLVCELLADAGYRVFVVQDVEDLLKEAARRAPCIALVDGTDPGRFDLWWLGPKLQALGVPPVAFTAHVSARAEFEADPQRFVGIVSKPFDAEEFINLVDAICWEESTVAAS